jgi:hypothetical protein
LRLARNSTARTQPTNKPAELTSFYQKGESARTVMMFSNQLNKIMNGIYARAPKLARNFKDAESRESLEALVFSTMLGGMGIWAATNGKFPETEEEFKNYLANTVLSGSGWLGGFAMQEMSGYDYEIPAIGVAKEGVKLGQKLADKDKRDDIGLRDMDMLLAGIGVPVTGVKRAYNAADSGNLSELFFTKKNEKAKKYNID